MNRIMRRALGLGAAIVAIGAAGTLFEERFGRTSRYEGALVLQVDGVFKECTQQVTFPISENKRADVEICVRDQMKKEDIEFLFVDRPDELELQWLRGPAVIPVRCSWKTEKVCSLALTR